MGKREEGEGEGEEEREEDLEERGKESGQLEAHVVKGHSLHAWAAGCVPVSAESHARTRGELRWHARRATKLRWRARRAAPALWRCTLVSRASAHEHHHDASARRRN